MAKEKPVRVLTFGTFDLFHPGHLSYLEQAKVYGDQLFVLVACDQAVLYTKNKLPHEGERKRLDNVKKIDFVTEAWIGELVHSREDYLRPITKVKPDIVCLGYDQALKEEEWLKNEMAKMDLAPRLIRLKPFKEDIYKTSIIAKDLKEKTTQ